MKLFIITLILLILAPVFVLLIESIRNFILKLCRKLPFGLALIVFCLLFFIPGFPQVAIYTLILMSIYVLLRVYIPKLAKVILKLNSVDIEFNNETYTVSRKRAEIIETALSGDRKSQYELATEVFESSRNSDFIPNICFYFTKLISDEETDLGIMVQLGNLYQEGIGVKKNKNKALEIYKHALDLYDNPSPNLYIPSGTDFRQYLINLIDSINK